MARINIDIGTLGNPATGDTLRTAMQKINTNFTEVYSLVRDGSSGLIATDVTNGDLKLQANGTGSIEIDTLSIQNSTITSIGTNSDITITPNGTGNVVLGNFTFNADQTVSASEDNYVFTYDHSTGTIGLEASAAGDVTASSTTTFTNKTFDANGTGNSISNLEVADFAAASIVTEAEGIGSNDNDTTIPTSAAVKDYVDARDIGDLSVVGSTISAPSNADLTLTTSGTGSVSIDGIQVSGTEISSTDSTQVTIKENLHVTGTITGDGSGLTGVVASGISSPATIDNITLDDNIISTSSNANLNLNPGGTGTVELQADTNIAGDATATTFIGAMRGATVFQAKATEDISKGEAVYISGLSGNTPEVALARANSASTMPAFGIAESDIANTATGNIVTFGSCPGHDVADFGETSITFALGDTVYISSAEAGKLTNVAPTGESNLIQNIGKIERVAPTTNMTIKVGGAGRTNATPALDNGNIFIGNGSNQSSTVSLATQIKSYTGLTVVGDDSSGTGFNIGETIKVAGATGITTAVSGDTLTITGPTLTSYITASSSDTLTNKTIDANGTGNSITNLEVADFAAASIVTAAEGIGSNNNDTTIPTSAAVKAYADSVGGGGGSTGDLTISGSTISAPSNADLTLNAGGTGSVDIDGIQIKGTSISSTDSTQININENVNIDGTLTVSGSTLSGTLNTAGNTGTGSVALASESLQVTGTTNEINVDAAAFALSLSLADNISGIVSVTASGFLANDAVKIDDNKISGLRSNEDILIDPAGTGRLEVISGANVLARFNGSSLANDQTVEIDITGPQSNGGANLGVGGSGVTDASNNLDNKAFLTADSTLDGVNIRADKADGFVQITAGGITSSDEVARFGASQITHDVPTKFNANALFQTGVEEKFATLTGSTGTVTHNCDNGHVFYHTGASGDITANFTNLGLTAEYGTNLTVIINQGATPYEVTAVQIGGAAQTINWQGGSAPTGNANGIDSFSFTILNDGGTYVVLGQMVDFT